VFEDSLFVANTGKLWNIALLVCVRQRTGNLSSFAGNIVLYLPHQFYSSASGSYLLPEFMLQQMIEKQSLCLRKQAQSRGWLASRGSGDDESRF
jgi:hypothetical protein